MFKIKIPTPLPRPYYLAAIFDFPWSREQYVILSVLSSLIGYELTLKTTYTFYGHDDNNLLRRYKNASLLVQKSQANQLYHSKHILCQ
jgi:hypothetical protein